MLQQYLYNIPKIQINNGKPLLFLFISDISVRGFQPLLYNAKNSSKCELAGDSGKIFHMSNNTQIPFCLIMYIY